jgi:hypothetical protein
MGSMTAQQVYYEILAHMKKQGGPYRSWYIGITSDVEKRLFIEHKVNKDGDWWIFRACQDNSKARSVEEALLQLGCDGGPGGGDRTSTHLYANLITSTTVQ